MWRVVTTTTNVCIGSIVSLSSTFGSSWGSSRSETSLMCLICQDRRTWFGRSTSCVALWQAESPLNVQCSERLQPRRVRHRGGFWSSLYADNEGSGSDHWVARSTCCDQVGQRQWDAQRGVPNLGSVSRLQITFTQPGKPTQNTYVERYHRTVRHEWPDQHLSSTIEDAQQTAPSGYGFTITNCLIGPSGGSHRSKN